MKNFKLVLALLVLTLTIGLMSCSPSKEAIGKSFIRDNAGNDIPAVVIAPTGGQSFGYAFEAGYAVWFVIGLALIVFAAYVLFRFVIGFELLKKGNVALIAVSLALGFAAIFSQPLSIKWNNDHKVPEDQYYYYLNKDGNIKAIWDSLDNGHIIGGRTAK